jgi:putative DeoR family transcriptional regulator (stage III sporulation protein D)
MKDYIEIRAKAVAHHILDTGETARQTAKKFGVSKSCIDKDISRLAVINPILHSSVNRLMQEHIAVKHIRGGAATSRKYKALKTHSL